MVKKCEKHQEKRWAEEGLCWIHYELLWTSILALAWSETTALSLSDTQYASKNQTKDTDVLQLEYSFSYDSYVIKGMDYLLSYSSGSALPSATMVNKLHHKAACSSGYKTTLLLKFCREWGNLLGTFVLQQQIFTTSNWQVWILGYSSYHPEKQFSTLTAILYPQWLVSAKEAHHNGTVLGHEVLAEQQHNGLAKRNKHLWLASIMQHHF